MDKVPLLEQIIPFFSLCSIGSLGIAALACFFLPKFSQKSVYVKYLPLLGSFLAWGFSLLTFLKVPFYYPWFISEADVLFVFIPTFIVDGFSLPIVQMLLTVNLARFLFIAYQEQEPQPSEWAGFLTLTMLSSLACFASNPLTLLITWVSLDAVEVWLSYVLNREGGKFIFLSIPFALRMVLSFVFLWAMAFAQGSALELSMLMFSPQLGMYVFFFVVFRFALIQSQDFLAPNLHSRLVFIQLTQIISCFVVLTKLAPLDFFGGTTLWFVIVSIILVFLTYAWIRVSSFPLLSRKTFLIFFLFVLAAYLRNEITTVVVWSISLIIFSHLFSVEPSLTHLRKWSIVPVAVAALALPFTPMWYTAALYAPLWTVNTNNFSPLIDILSSVLLLIAQGITLVVLIKQMRSFSPISYVRRELITTIPEMVMVLIVWLAYFGIGFWLALNSPNLLLWVGVPLGAVVLLVFGLSELLGHSRKKSDAIAVTLLEQERSMSSGNQFIEQLRKRYKEISMFVTQRAFTMLLNKISLATFTQGVSIVSEMVEGEGGIIWGFILFIFLISFLFQTNA